MFLSELLANCARVNGELSCTYLVDKLPPLGLWLRRCSSLWFAFLYSPRATAAFDREKLINNKNTAENI